MSLSRIVTAPNWALTSSILALTILAFAAGCGGRQGMTSPQLYGNQTGTASTTAKPDSSDSAVTTDKSTATSSADSGSSSTPGNSDWRRMPSWMLGADSVRADKKTAGADPRLGFPAGTDYEDSASAVDDDIWRELDLAEEYHAMGVIANREGSWEEAQYYFEKALRVLAALDIEGDSLETPEATQYSRTLEDIIADYRITLLSLGTLQEDVSAAVLIERFGDLVNNLADDTMKVYSAEKPEIMYDIPIVMNDRVKKSIVYYQTVARDAFTKFLRRSKKYRGMMSRILTEHDMPQDLVYLSMVESGYNPRAYSWARASGLWQFIASTGRLYGLDRNWWLDERRDPIKSTHAACRFLKDLYKEFGSWELAMAAYNGGPGRVRRTIAKQGTRDFWQLKLRRQTMDYVPLIMAATIIAKDPEKYGFSVTDFEAEIVWDEVEIDKCLELSTVAKTIGCSVDDLHDLNPELLRKYTPPNEKKYKLKLPVGTRQKFMAAYADLPSPKETSWVQHKIQKGETISTIASRYGVSQYAIMEANNMSRRSTIYAGHNIIVPVPLDQAGAGGSMGSSSRRSNKDYDSHNGLYVVRSGDTMWDIAKAFGCSVDDLREINYIERGSRIYVGQKMKIPSTATNKSRSTEAYAAAGDDSDTPGTYKVRPGDTLWDIARRYGTTTSHIRSLNGLGRSSRIYPGQVLKVGGNRKGGGNSTDGATYVIHQVRRGENLSAIARRYRTSTRSIIETNNLTDPDNLLIGEKLKIYTN